MKQKLLIIINRIFAFQKVILFFFIVLLGGIITLGILFYRNNETLHNTNYWVLHTHGVIEQATQVASFSKDIQWESRTFILTGDKNSINSYYNARDNLQKTLTRLSKLASDNSQQE